MVYAVGGPRRLIQLQPLGPHYRRVHGHLVTAAQFQNVIGHDLVLADLGDGAVPQHPCPRRGQDRQLVQRPLGPQFLG